jgi:hypothetical protein
MPCRDAAEVATQKCGSATESIGIYKRRFLQTSALLGAVSGGPVMSGTSHEYRESGQYDSSHREEVTAGVTY